MRLQRLILTAFGRFQGRTVELGPGLNVIYGPNEAGKSTLQQFLCGMLYGLKKPGQRRSYTAELARYRPWQGGDYRGTLIYTLDGDGRTYRVERVFEPEREEVRVYDEVTGADLTAQFPMDRRKELQFAEAHLGMGEELFRATAWVGQMQVGRVELGRELADRLANLQESGREDLSVRSALDWLAERAREIGSARAPTRPYGQVLRAMAEKRAELERAEQLREQVRGWEASLAQVRTALAAVEVELAEAGRRLEWARLREAEERLRRAEAARARVRELRAQAESLVAYASFPAGEAERLRAQLAEAEAAAARAARHHARLKELSAQLADLQRQMDRYPGMAAVSPDAAAEVAASSEAARATEVQLAGLRQEEARLAEALERTHEALAEARTRRDGKGRVVSDGTGYLFAAAVALVLAGLAGVALPLPAGLLVALACGVGAAVCGALYMGARRRHAEAEAERRERLVRLEQLTARAEAQQDRLRSLRAEMERLEAEAARHRARWVGTVARALGIPEAEARADDGAGEQFRRAYHAYQDLKRLADGLRREIAAAEAEAAEETAIAGRDRQAAEAILAAAGVPDPAAFEEGVTRRQTYERALQEAEALETALRSQLGGEEPETLAAEVERLREEVRGEMPEHLPPAEELREEIERLSQRRAELQAQARDLNARVETALAEAPESADLMRELEALEAERAAFEEELAAIELARQTIAEVASEIHRDFAPRLNEAMGALLTRLTGGRYRTVRVDESLGIRAIDGDGRTVELTALSAGTVDQFYLGLRLALLDLLTQGGESVPLLLDDPFVQYDDRRARSALAFLAEAARDRQVLLMTCHQREVRLAQELAPEARIIRIAEAEDV